MACFKRNGLCGLALLLACCSENKTPNYTGSTPKVDAATDVNNNNGSCQGMQPGTPLPPVVTDGYFDNDVFFGFGHTWLQGTTSASSATLGCAGGTSCVFDGRALCGHFELEGATLTSSPQAGIELAVRQESDPSDTPSPFAPNSMGDYTGDGLYVALWRSQELSVTVQLNADEADAGASRHFCAPIMPVATDAKIPWSDFKLCDTPNGEAYSPSIPITSITLGVRQQTGLASTFDLCLLDAVTYGLPHEVISCSDWQRYTLPGTPYVFINNVWNAQHAGTYPYKQCLINRCAQFSNQIGWTWDWPPLDLTTSFAAPEILFGRKPWDGGASTTPDLPQRIDKLESMQLDFAVDAMADPTYNLNATMWLTQTEAAPAAEDPEDIVAEVMVRFNNPANLGACCTLDGVVTLGGIDFEVWHQDAHADASGSSSYTWKMVIYRAGLAQVGGSLDLSLVLNDMVARGLALPSNGVQGVELITEVSGGKGEVWVNQFGVKVTPKN